ncbi:GxxExxY protein [Candidatus Parcubacteria bacterium]|nr:GxxExxY protein [Candidatus Parcubacteria bacterium]
MVNQKIKRINIQIKKLAKEVYGELGSRFDECVYQRALEVGLRLTKVRYETQLEIREIKI